MNPHRGGRPPLPEDKLMRTVSTRLHPEAAEAARRLAAGRGVNPSVFCRDLILRKLEEETGYADYTQHVVSPAGRDSYKTGPWLWPALPAEAIDRANRLAAEAGLTPNAWRAQLVYDELAAAGYGNWSAQSPAARPAGDFAAAVEALEGLDISRDDAIRALRREGHSLGRVAGYYGISRERVRQIARGDGQGEG